MKKVYEAPSVEKVAFQYRDQVVVASGPVNEGRCYIDYKGDLGHQNSPCLDDHYTGDMTK